VPFDHFEPCLFGTDEHELFYRLPFEDRYMGYGQIGHMRGELYHRGFRSFWVADAPHLSTPAFRREIKSLRSALGLGLLNGSHMSMEHCSTAPAVGERDTGFKICTDSYSYYFRCTPALDGYDITMYAYDNSLLMPEMAGLHELPEKCYTVQDGELLLLRQEHPQKSTVDLSVGPATTREIADELNAELGVTKAQEAAMRMGVEHSFHEPCAWPWQYDQDGEPRCKSQKNMQREAR